MKRLVLPILLFLVMPVFAAYSGNLGNSIDSAMDSLGCSKGDSRMCVLSNSLYVDPAAVDILQEHTGCTIGNANLLFYHTPTDADLTVALFRRDIREAVVITAGKNGLKRNIKLGIDRTLAEQKAPWEQMRSKIGPDAVTIVTICNAWADGAPYDLLKCAEFHNHVCRGICSGYVLSRFIRKHYPIKDPQSYLYIACPVWCKEEALQVLLDITPGKHRLIVKNLSSKQLTHLPSKDVAGILVIRQSRFGPGQAHVLTFDWEKALAGSNSKGGLKPNPISWNDPPETYIHVVYEIDLSTEQINLLGQAGVNPYDVIGYVRVEK